MAEGDGLVREPQDRRPALEAVAGWAVPLQLSAILLTGGLTAYLAVTGRWQGWDWLFVGLCAIYLVNALGFRWLRKRLSR